MVNQDMGKLKQKNFRIYELQQKMIDEMLVAWNDELAKHGIEEKTEAEFIRYCIMDRYKQCLEQGVVSKHPKEL